ncbi:TetR family transcriptional regulator [Ilumatobacter fluminis]|uniref:TetR family transcriptional regulator n=1 Tax=Ilumatobacter fluminis TaxID=467091 RepID=A0A4V3EJG3_9ACTN|nr:TetR/AcrR family transcriptional regulator [Ilumatobacter fluminis]TDT18248.1 TetR family transcriptional regulator [Ilumatobacter fluminis]
MARGRTRDEDAERRVLEAAFELVGSRPPGEVGINDIAAAANVAKQTIYRWWPSRTAVILDALVVGTMRATPFRETDDIRADFEAHLRTVIKLFNSPTGRIVREMLAEAHTDPTIADEFRQRFWQPRRDLSQARLRRGIELGQIRDDLDHEIVLDAIYGPLWTRLMIGHLPLRAADAARVTDAIWPGIAAARA